MTIIRRLLMAKALGIIQGIEKMGEKERLGIPGGAFAENYNLLREQVIKNHSNLKDLMPGHAGTYLGGDSRTRYSEVTYSDFMVRCTEIYQMLSVADECS